jgi:hypothetical protein
VPPQDLQQELSSFVDEYAQWIDAREAEAATLPAHHSGAAERLLCRMREARERMREGIVVLAHNETVRTSFRLANRTMCRTIVAIKNGQQPP